MLKQLTPEGLLLAIHRDKSQIDLSSLALFVYDSSRYERRTFSAYMSLRAELLSQIVRDV